MNKSLLERTLKAMIESRDDVASTISEIPTYKINYEHRLAMATEQLAEHDACIKDLKAAIAEQAEPLEPVAHSVIAGALFDFMGWLTTRDERLVLSCVDNASPAAEAITEFAKLRKMSLVDARVKDWNTRPQALEPMSDIEQELKTLRLLYNQSQEDVLRQGLIIEEMMRDKQEPMSEEEIRMAIGRGWAHEKNAYKVMDVDLSLAIADEVKKALLAKYNIGVNK